MARRERLDLGGELDRARMRIRPIGVERELAHLRGGGLADLVAEAVADLHGEQARQGVEIALAVCVLEVAAVAAHDDRNVAVRVRAHAREVQPEMIAREALELGDVDLRAGCGHTTQPKGLATQRPGGRSDASFSSTAAAASTSGSSSTSRSKSKPRSHGSRSVVSTGSGGGRTRTCFG